MIREIIIILFLMILLIGFVDKIPIILSQEYDPPSIFNTGGGGYYIFYTLLIRSGYKTDVIYSMEDLYKIDPETSVLIIASPDTPLSQEDSEKIIIWISRGGFVLALDEIGSLDNLLRKVDVYYGSLIGTVAYAKCVINNKTYEIFLNKYSYIHIKDPENTSYIGTCLESGDYVGFLKKIGSGELFFIGDSSLFINNMIYRKSVSENIVLFRDFVGDREIIFYEGNRVFKIIRMDQIVMGLGSMIRIFSNSIGMMMSKDPLITLSIISFVTIFATLIYFREETGAVKTFSQTRSINNFKEDKKYVVRRYREWLQKSRS
jgi:hypothetical protein